ncbi:5-hydroxytryptamine receptor 3A-like [Sphaeramia orbicularis]|uniref:5-hydroxytryptamine receptor 3A-like n=1 Tax=Sphaeramia orbicularis TaxID=375764 RepID=A0A673AEF4_9TELE|nr:5-hydroxytryptamine receptor 3A-like [Sphaeramia orbicularis]XP_029997961.1 5-hydroxytryptamine receptor 3A-like [Sphaeramia orbicularis]
MSLLRTVAVFTFIVGVSSSESSNCSYLALWNHLRLTTSNDFLATVRPVKNWTKPTEVWIDLMLYGILDVDEKTQTIVGNIWTKVIWNNEFLTWNPMLFCEIDLITVPRSLLWIPDLVIQEDASDTGSLQMSPFVSLVPAGLLYTTFRQRLTFTCQLNLSLFPFDSQTCNITFSSMVHSARSMILKALKNDTQLNNFTDRVMKTRGEWELKSIKTWHYYSAEKKWPESNVLFLVKIVRRPMLYLINFIIPLLYFIILDLASFFIDEAGGEKLSFKVTVLLSISVLLLILKDMLPSTEDNLPLIASYCVGIFAMVGISVLETMLVSFLISLDNEQDKDANSSGDAGVDIQLEVKHDEVTDDVNSENCSPPLNRHGDRTLLRRIQEELKALRRETRARGEGRRKPGCFRRIAHVIDCLFFILYFLAVVIFLLFMYVKWIEAYIQNEKDER